MLIGKRRGKAKPLIGELRVGGQAQLHPEAEIHRKIFGEGR